MQTLSPVQFLYCCNIHPPSLRLLCFDFFLQIFANDVSCLQQLNIKGGGRKMWKSQLFLISITHTYQTINTSKFWYHRFQWVLSTSSLTIFRPASSSGYHCNCMQYSLSRAGSKTLNWRRVKVQILHWKVCLQDAPMRSRGNLLHSSDWHWHQKIWHP